MALRQQILRSIGVGIGAFALGALDSLVKGQGYGIIGALSETVVPWFLLAFLAGALMKGDRVLWGAIAGFGATMCGLVGFYFVNSFLFNFGALSWLTNFHSALGTGRVPFEFGIVSGVVFGALGMLWKRELTIIPVVGLGVAFVLEALARAWEGSNFFWHGHAVGVIESFVGLIWIAAAIYVTMAVRRRPRPRTTRLPHDGILRS
jgi:hypothetical protein